jgi:hypothetical protein
MTTFRERLLKRFDDGVAYSNEHDLLVAGARIVLELLADINCEAAALLPKENQIAQACADERVKDAVMLRRMAKEWK